MLESKEATKENVDLLGLQHRVYLSEDGKTKERNRGALVLVHGRAGDAKVMWVFSKAVQEIKPVVVSPEAYIPDLQGFSWWDIHQREVNESLSVEEKIKVLLEPVEKLHRFVAKLPEVYGVDAKNIYAAGFSQGGGVLAALSIKYPDIFKGVALLSSFIPKSAIEHAELLNPNFTKTTRTSYFIFHGTQDEILPIGRSEEAAAFLAERGAEVRFETDDVGHKVSSKGIKALGEWFGEKW